MAELYLVRHGQASYGSGDYDRLSDLGWRQSRWLGEYFAERGVGFDRIVRGTLRRHAETLAGIGEGLGAAIEHGADPGLNEYDILSLLAAHYADEAPAAHQGEDRRAHFRMLREALYAWAEGTLAGEAHERFDAFRSRVRGALESVRAYSSADRILVVSSGGPIATIIGEVLGLAPRRIVDLNLQLRNASISEFRFNARAIHCVSFNTIPHLDRPDRAEALTYA
jgi:broad specificity phosphatase PhoE